LFLKIKTMPQVAKKKKEPTTKLGIFLQDNGITQLDLYYLIQFKMGKEIGMDRISNLVNGKKTNINMDTAKTICKALEVTYDDIFDVE